MRHQCATSRTIVCLALFWALLGACGDDDDGSPAAEAGTATSLPSDDSDGGGSGSGDCSPVDAATVADAFAIEVTSVEEPATGHCFFAVPSDPERPDAGITVLRNELGAVLYDEFATEITDTGEGSGGSGVIEVDLGDDAIAAPGPDAVDLAARSGEVNVRVTAVMPSTASLTGNELVAAATELAGEVL